jgi:hypothetical protein
MNCYNVPSDAVFNSYWFKTNVSSPNLTGGYTISFGGLVGEYSTMILYDIMNASSQPFVQCVTNANQNNTDGATAATLVTITPNAVGDLILAQNGNYSNTATNSNGTFTGNWWLGQTITGPENFDENNFWCDFISSSTAATNIIEYSSPWSGNNTPISYFAALALEIQ